MQGFEQSIVEIVAGIWDQVLQQPIVEEDVFTLSLAREQTYAGVVQINGAWEGAVALLCSQGMARRAAEIMFQVAEPNVTLGDIQDALGELANMVGGNFKALLPEPCQLSLPVVIEGTDFRMRLPGATQILQRAFRSDANALSVTVLQRNVAAV